MRRNKDLEKPDYRYNQWAGNPKGRRQDPERCVEVVHDRISSLMYQCQRKRGHGPGGFRCKQHAKMIED